MGTIDLVMRERRSLNNEELRAMIQSAMVGARPMTYLDALNLINEGQARPYSYESFRAYFVNLESPRWRPVSDKMIERAREVIKPLIVGHPGEDDQDNVQNTHSGDAADSDSRGYTTSGSSPMRSQAALL